MFKLFEKIKKYLCICVITSTLCQFIVPLGVYARTGITDVTPVFRMIDYNYLREFILVKNEDQCLEISRATAKRVTDKAAKDLIYQEFGTYSPMAEKDYDRQALDESIRKIIRKGVSIRQLSRLTGISKKVIESSLKKEKD